VQVHTFIAESAVQAVEQIRQQLGSQAVVLNVRKLPGGGLARFWQKPRIEVLACLPEVLSATTPAPNTLAGLRQELTEIEEKVQQQEPAFQNVHPGAAPISSSHGESPQSYPLAFAPDCAPSGQEYRRTLAGLLESSGLLPVHVQRVLDELRGELGEDGVESLAEQLRLARNALVRLWRSPRPPASNCHLFIGPPGAGKTTALSKWLAQAALVEGRRARVWRLDGHVANTAESLSVLAEVLGVPLERCRPDEQAFDPSELIFVDLPGVNWNDGALLDDLARRLAAFPRAEVHLVLNAAYEGKLLLAQARAFSALPVHSLVLTHLDEEPRWGKLWNLTLGTNFSVGYLSSGQNIPGSFHPADPERILAPHFPRN
jgi:flagellar biosynthesis protein FlhF